MSKTILVVGGAGYIGSHMIKALFRSGYDVIILDNFSTGHRHLVKEGTLIEGDLGDAELVDQVLKSHPIDAVMHFAAFSLVGESVEFPLKYYRNNVAKTITLLESMKRHNVKSFIFSSTAAVYGEPESSTITESHPRRPTNPYGNSKLAVERMLKDCDGAFGLKYVSLRYFNAAGADKSGTIGECHDPESHLIPLILKTAAGLRDHVSIFGTDYPTPDGTCLRDYVHVSDLAQAHILALEAILSGEKSAVYNLGNSKGYSVRQVIETAEKVSGCAIPVVESERRAGDPAVLVAASDFIRKELGWKPIYEDLESIIETAWNWHKKEKNGSLFP